MFDTDKFGALGDTLAAVIQEVIDDDESVYYVHIHYYPKDAQAAGWYDVSIGTSDGNIYTYYSFNGEWTKYDTNKGTITLLTEEGAEE